MESCIWRGGRCLSQEYTMMCSTYWANRTSPEVCSTYWANWTSPEVCSTYWANRTSHEVDAWDTWDKPDTDLIPTQMVLRVAMSGEKC